MWSGFGEKMDGVWLVLSTKITWLGLGKDGWSLVRFSRKNVQEMTGGASSRSLLCVNGLD